MSKMNDEDLLSVVRGEAANTIGTSDTDSELGKQRTKALNYYNGTMPDFPHLPGWSSVTSKDVFETVQAALPDLLEIFTSNNDVMEFIPESEDDIDKARQETDVVNNIFYQQNKGFLVLYCFIQDALVAKNGFVKANWEDREEDVEEEFFKQSDEELVILQEDPDIEIIEVDTETTKTGEFIVIADPVTGIESKEEIIFKSHDVVARRIRDTSGVKVQCIAPEELSISRDALDLQKASLVRHTPRNVTRSHLLEIGIEEKKVAGLTTLTQGVDDLERQARDTLNQDDVKSVSTNWPMQNVDVADNYIRVDMRGNKRAELWHVMTGNDDTVVLSKTRISRVPISTMTPIIEPHELFGKSLAELVMDLQRVKTFLNRAALDNAAAMNNQRPIISESGATDSTIDDVLTVRPGSPIMVKGDARAALAYAPNNSIVGDMVGFIQYFDSVRDQRTGITRNGQDMDANSIRKDISATEFAGQRADALKTIKLIARVFAETGMKDMFINIHHAAQAHSGNKELAFRINKQFITVNPREWKIRTDMQINVGLGTGTKSEQLGQLNVILERQLQAWEQQGGKDGPLVDLVRIRNTLARQAELTGVKDADTYWKPFTEKDQIALNKINDAVEPPEDPALIKIRADAANNQQKNEITHANNVANAQIKQQDNDLDRQVKIFQITQELELKAKSLNLEFDFETAHAQAKLILEKQQIDFNQELATLQTGFELAEKADGIEQAERVAISEANTNLTNDVRIGGDVAG